VNKKENYTRTVEFNYPEWIICQANLMPGTWKKHREKLEDIVIKHPRIFGPYKKGEKDFDELTRDYQKGEYTDEWGCHWRNLEDGLVGIVVKGPLENWQALDSFKPPDPGEQTALKHGFLFMRLFYLRGFENMILDMVNEDPRLLKLIKILEDYNMTIVKNCIKEGGDILWTGEDLGSQDRLMITPKYWRKYIKPSYKKLFGTARDAGLQIYLHSDGHILEIVDDLIECGVTILNPQIRANTLEGLVKVCKGKVCINLDLDRQLFPFATPQQIDEHIKKAIDLMWMKKGGLMLSAECGPDVSLEKIEAICQSLEKYCL